MELTKNVLIKAWKLSSKNEGLNARTIYYPLVMRFLDKIIASIGILLGLPLFALIPPLIMLDSKGNVLFKQERVGQNRRVSERRRKRMEFIHLKNRKGDRRRYDRGGMVFTMLKFRSMKDDAEKNFKNVAHLNEEPTGLIIKIPNDPRVTRIGRFLRKSSLDELPQLFNIMKGEMSLVGPRPPSPHEVAQYNSRQKKRLNAMPGVTGLWQVSGRKDTNFDFMVEKDIKYIENQSLGLNIKILLKTIPCILFGKGAR